MKTNTNKLKQLIQDQVHKLKEELKERGCKVNFLEQRDGGYLVWGFSLKKVVIINSFKVKDNNKKSHYVVASFMLNTNLYNWASAEGFSTQQMIDLFDKKIFNPIDLDDIADYLCKEV